MWQCQGPCGWLNASVILSDLILHKSRTLWPSKPRKNLPKQKGNTEKRKIGLDAFLQPFLVTLVFETRKELRYGSFTRYIDILQVVWLFSKPWGSLQGHVANSKASW